MKLQILNIFYNNYIIELFSKKKKIDRQLMNIEKLCYKF